MITGNIGVGHISGEVWQVTAPMGAATYSTPHRVEARELFGSDWVPFAGAGVGITTDVNKKLNLTVTAVGVEHLSGIYYGRIGGTYRF